VNGELLEMEPEVRNGIAWGGKKFRAEEWQSVFKAQGKIGASNAK